MRAPHSPRILAPCLAITLSALACAMVCGMAMADPDLTIDKRHTVPFIVGQQGEFSIVVTNVGTSATTSVPIVRDTLPAGITFVSAGGTGWNIARLGQLVITSYTGAIAAGDSAQFQMQVGVTASAIPSVTNSASVSTTGDPDPGNDRDSDFTLVSAPTAATRRSWVQLKQRFRR